MTDVEDLPPHGRFEVLQILADGRHWESVQTMITGGQVWIDALKKPMAELSALAAVAMRKEGDGSLDSGIPPVIASTGHHRKTSADAGPT